MSFRILTTAVLAGGLLTVAAPASAGPGPTPCIGTELQSVPVTTAKGARLGWLTVVQTEDGKCAVTTTEARDAHLNAFIAVCATPAEPCEVIAQDDAYGSGNSVETVPLPAAGLCVAATASITIGHGPTVAFGHTDIGNCE
ncbi:hypothetical protein Afil01_06830 [Actinorhabdospora filicis]|uniref:Secreted protein n=1 Tax=Actinorhabdospora filicis TaxID=1785913 RepID=A0A9W6W7W0_9ACTN|nr:hypothetical protein [Actinorhabdospora filicis]GLZ75876.1 hypothetical protein Afil01_06830 [Actinorhabdospora filicis]